MLYRIISCYIYRGVGPVWSVWCICFSERDMRSTRINSRLQNTVQKEAIKTITFLKPTTSLGWFRSWTSRNAFQPPISQFRQQPSQYATGLYESTSLQSPALISSSVPHSPQKYEVMFLGRTVRSAQTVGKYAVRTERNKLKTPAIEIILSLNGYRRFHLTRMIRMVFRKRHYLSLSYITHHPCTWVASGPRKNKIRKDYAMNQTI